MFSRQELGILMRFSFAFVASGPICGALLTMKARFLKFWPSRAGTGARALSEETWLKCASGTPSVPG